MGLPQAIFPPPDPQPNNMPPVLPHSTISLADILKEWGDLPTDITIALQLLITLIDMADEPTVEGKRQQADTIADEQLIISLQYTILSTSEWKDRLTQAFKEVHEAGLHDVIEETRAGIDNGDPAVRYYELVTVDEAMEMDPNELRSELVRVSRLAAELKYWTRALEEALGKKIDLDRIAHLLGNHEQEGLEVVQEVDEDENSGEEGMDTGGFEF